MQRGNETKSRIYNAAKELFYENGYSGTTIQQIAQRAGTTLGGTTYHYNTKEKFISQIFGEWNNAVYSRMRRSDIRNETSVFMHFVLTFNYHRELLTDEHIKRFYYEIMKDRSLYSYTYDDLNNVYYNFVRDFGLPINNTEIECVIIADFGARREFMMQICSGEYELPLKDVSMFVFSNTARALGLPAEEVRKVGQRAYEYYVKNQYTDIKILQ